MSVSCDRQVDATLDLFATSPLDGAEKMPTALGIEQPAGYDHWVDFIGVDPSQIPIAVQAK